MVITRLSTLISLMVEAFEPYEHGQNMRTKLRVEMFRYIHF